MGAGDAIGIIPGVLMLDERKAAILRAVVEEYIDTAQPVGSGHVANAPGVTVSSATVRNDMVVLEQEGFLHQPHTSAGRVPTDKGYRFFVDNLVEPQGLDARQAEQVRAFFNRAHGELEEMLHDTSRLLANLTDCAAVVVGPPHDVATVRSIQLVDLTERVVLVVAVLSNGVVEKRTIECDDPVAPEQLAAVAAHLGSHLVGTDAGAVAAAPPTGDAAVDRLVAASLAALGGTDDDDQVFVDGAFRMANAFEAVETVRSVLSILEQQLVVVTLVRDVLDRGLSVAIGTETGMEPLNECALVVSPYEVAGEPAGSIAVLGPSRMHYPQALAAVAVVSQRLSRRLTEG
ncbi:MAG: heat-inducible transcription repressor HrcA [Acidimicrobiales bacterium]|nr:heat-inducible transcription repressor HrcA [Acidimicrobiales bacterium]